MSKKRNRQPSNRTPRYRCGSMPGVSPSAFRSKDDPMLGVLEPFFGFWAIRFLARVRSANPSVAGLFETLRRHRVAPADAEAICAVYRENRSAARPRLDEDRAAPGRGRRWHSPYLNY